MCALRGRESRATTTGFTALDGLPTGTRCGALDPDVVLYLLSEQRMWNRLGNTPGHDRAGYRCRHPRSALRRAGYLSHFPGAHPRWSVRHPAAWRQVLAAILLHGGKYLRTVESGVLFLPLYLVVSHVVSSECATFRPI